MNALAAVGLLICATAKYGANFLVKSGIALAFASVMITNGHSAEISGQHFLSVGNLSFKITVLGEREINGVIIAEHVFPFNPGMDYMETKNPGALPFKLALIDIGIGGDNHASSRAASRYRAEATYKPLMGAAAAFVAKEGERPAEFAVEQRRLTAIGQVNLENDHLFLEPELAPLTREIGAHLNLAEAARFYKGFADVVDAETSDNHGDDRRPEHGHRPMHHVFLGFQVSIFALFFFLALWGTNLGFKVADRSLDADKLAHNPLYELGVILGVIISTGSAIGLPFLGYWLAFESRLFGLL